MNDKSIEIYTIASGDITIWVEPSGPICIKLNTKFNDPIELAEHEAMELANLLIRLAKAQQL